MVARRIILLGIIDLAPLEQSARAVRRSANSQVRLIPLIESVRVLGFEENAANACDRFMSFPFTLLPAAGKESAAAKGLLEVPGEKVKISGFEAPLILRRSGVPAGPGLLRAPGPARRLRKTARLLRPLRKGSRPSTDDRMIRSARAGSPKVFPVGYFVRVVNFLPQPRRERSCWQPVQLRNRFAQLSRRPDRPSGCSSPEGQSRGEGGDHEKTTWFRVVRVATLRNHGVFRSARV
jgi:hypothetical protein